METNSISADGRIYSGRQAVGVFQAKVLLGSLKLYAKTGIIPTRGVGIKRMMALASEIAGKPFKASKRDIPAACEALELMIAASTHALQDPS